MSSRFLAQRIAASSAAGATAILCMCNGEPANAQQLQDDAFEAALAASRAQRPAATNPPVALPERQAAIATPPGGRGRETSRYFKRNNMTVEERRANSKANRAPPGLVPPQFRSKPASQEQLEAANVAILRREMDPHAYLVGATAGAVLPPEARLVPCGGNERHLFYTLGTEDPNLLNNLAMRAAVNGSPEDARRLRITASKSSTAPGATIAKAAAFLTDHGYRQVKSWERNLYAPVDERLGQASILVTITENAQFAMAACGYKGETPPPSGPGLQVRVHFPS